jgi:beta-glucanase (GH16 family)
MRLVVEENFEGEEINASLWEVYNMTHIGGVYTPTNVRVENGMLIIRTIEENVTVKGKQYYVTSGAVSTAGKFSQVGGRWEISVKLPQVSKSHGYTLHSSIWLTPNNPHASNTSGCAQEIDVVEQYPQGFGNVSQALAHVDAFEGGRVHRPTEPCHGGWLSAKHFGAVGDWTSNWTTFTLDWTPTWMTMSVNGGLYAVFNNTTGGGERLPSLVDPMFLWLTAAVMHREKPSRHDGFPLEYMVDWVRIYEWV